MNLTSVLVVDDEFLVRMNTADILREAGFEVTEARDASSALAALETTPGIRLVCTDLEMPGSLDGVGLIRRLQALNPEIQTIVISGSPERQPQLPSVPFLPKPFASSRLVEMARERLQTPQ
jgi:DNA-binding NtrC family response regulator